VAYIAPALRQEVIERAHGRCEYCLTWQAIVVEMEVDHVRPESMGGLTEASNLCLTCAGCNAFKLAFQSGRDPETGDQTRLFNPRGDRWEEHFRWNDDGVYLLGLTAVGRATVGNGQRLLACTVAQVQ